VDKDIQTLVIELWTQYSLRRTFDYMCPAQKRGSIVVGRRKLLGWDLLEMSRPLSSLDATRREFAVHEYQDGDPFVKTKPSWLELARENVTMVLFAHNLGEIITPTCAMCRQIGPPPQGKQYLITSFCALHAILTKQDCCYHLKNGLVWDHTDRDLFPQCHKQRRRSSEVRIQELRKQRHKNGCRAASKRLPVDPSCAVVFGPRLTRMVKVDSHLQRYVHSL